MFCVNLYSQTLREGVTESRWLKSQSLVVVFPTFTVKHERMAKALAREPEGSRNRVRAERQMARDVSFSDSLRIALHIAFEEHYSFGPWMMMADTTWQRWRRENGEVEVWQSEMQPSRRMLDNSGQLLFMRRGLSDRQTGSNMAQWKFLPGDQRELHPRFPSAIPEGSIGVRLVEFTRAFLGIKDKYTNVPELLKLTSYVAKKTNREFERFHDKNYD